MDFLSGPMGWILAQLSKLFNNNFAVSVLVFTILVNIIMLPLTLKSQKSTAKQAKVKHKLDALKKKYGDDRQKYSVAMQELYNKEGISMGGGCLPMVVRLILMIGVYSAIMSPFSAVANVGDVPISAAKRYVAYVRVVESSKDTTLTDDQWTKLGFVSTGDAAKDKDAKIDILAKADSVTDEELKKAVKEVISKNAVTREVEIAEYFDTENEKYSQRVVDEFVKAGGDLNEVNKFNFDLFGIDLRGTPDFDINVVKGWNVNWLIPLSSFAAALITGIFTSRLQKKANPEAPNMMAMMIMMPVISLVIAFGFPCAVGFYWACSSLVSGIVQILIQIFYGPNVVNAKEQAKNIVSIAKKENMRIAEIDNASAE